MRWGYRRRRGVLMRSDHNRKRPCWKPYRYQEPRRFWRVTLFDVVLWGFIAWLGWCVYATW